MVIEYDNYDLSHSQVGEFLKELSKQVAVSQNKVIDKDILKSTNDIRNIIFSYSEKYYNTLRGPNGRFHHLDISNLLLTEINETFIDILMNVNNTPGEIPLHLSIEKLWNSKHMHAVLIGEGGMGKTVSIIRLWQKYLMDKNNNSPIPVFLALDEYNNAQPDERDYILKMIGRHYLGKWEINSDDINRLWNLLREPRKKETHRLLSFLMGSMRLL